MARPVSFSRQERFGLADALLAAGPQAPTLCGAWTAHDLAAHLVAREARGDASVGIIVPAVAAYTERVRLVYRRRPFEQLVQTFRSGPPLLSPFAVPGVDALGNLLEHVVHHEDVLRAAPDWSPRELPARLEDQLWRALSLGGRFLLRRSGVAVTLVRADQGGQETAKVTVRRGSPSVRLVGTPLELVLYAYNRKGVSGAQAQGPAAAVATLQAAPLGL